MNGNQEKKKIYLDNNATTPLEPEVISEITTALTNHWANPSSCHRKGLEARSVVERARKRVACMVGALPQEIVFTSGGTEANNLSIHSAIHHYHQNLTLIHKSPSLKPPTQLQNHSEPFQNTISSPTPPILECLGEGEGVDEKDDFVGSKNGFDKDILPHIITSSLEHDSIKLYLQHLQETMQAEVTTVCGEDGGMVDVDGLVNAVRPNTCLITVMMANNETGVVQPVKEIGQRLKRINDERHKHHLPFICFHSDVAQAVGKIAVDVTELGTNYISIVGHKFYGPRIGAVFCRGAFIHPMLFGGGQEKGWRPGTENTAMITGLGKACELVTLNLKEYSGRMKEVRDEMEKRLHQAFPNEIVVNCGEKDRLPNTCNFSFKHPLLRGRDVVDRLVVVEAGVGAACHAGVVCRPSPILLASGVPSNLAFNAIRLSVGRDTSLADVAHVVQDFKTAVQSALSDLNS